MALNLLEVVKRATSGDFIHRAGQMLGESEGATRGALDKLLPALIGGIAAKGATFDGARDLMALLRDADLPETVDNSTGSLRLTEQGAVFGTIPYMAPEQVVADPAEYPWSSFRANACGEADALVARHPNFLALGRNAGEQAGYCDQRGGVGENPPVDGPSAPVDLRQE